LTAAISPPITLIASCHYFHASRRFQITPRFHHFTFRRYTPAAIFIVSFHAILRLMPPLYYFSPIFSSLSPLPPPPLRIDVFSTPACQRHYRHFQPITLLPPASIFFLSFAAAIFAAFRRCCFRHFFAAISRHAD